MLIPFALALLPTLPQSLPQVPIVRLSDPVADAVVPVTSFRLSERGNRVLYSTAGRPGLLGALSSVRADSGARPVPLTEQAALPSLSPDGRWAAYALHQETWLVRTSGRGAPTLAASPAWPIRFVSGGRLLYRLLYRPEAPAGSELWSVEPDVPGSDVRLGAEVDFFDGPGSFETIRVTPREDQVVFATITAPFQRELQVASVDGSTPTRFLGVSIEADGLDRARFSPNGRVLVCEGRIDPDPALRLLAVPLDGSPPRILRELAGSEFFGLEVSAQAQAVVHLLEDGEYRLYGIPLDGSASTLLRRSAVGSRLVGLTTDGARAVVAGNLEFFWTQGGPAYEGGLAEIEFDVLSIALDGSAEIVQLNDQRAGRGTVFTDRSGVPQYFLPVYSGPGARVVFAEGAHLVAADVTGSAPAIVLADGQDEPPRALAFAPGGRVAVFWRQAGRIAELVQASLIRPRERVLARATVAGDLAFTPDGRGLIAVADLDLPGVTELYLVRPKGR